MLIKRLHIIIVALAIALSSCGVYSFTGASIAPDVKTVSIQYFKNYASLVQPTLSQTLTERLKDRFVTQTNLAIVNSGGDLDFENSITDYKTQPIAIQANDQASQNRLTITIKVKFTNKKDEKQNYESTFTRYADYSSTQNLATVEPELIKTINEQLVDDIFNKAVVNW